MLAILLEALESTVSTMATVFVLLFLTGILTEMGLFHRVSFIARPLASISRLPAVSASTFVVSLGSLLAANTMTARLKADGHLTERQAFLSALMNTVPVYFRELFTYQLAFVIPVLGVFVGGMYAIIFSFTGIAKLFIVMILGRRYLEADSISLEAAFRSLPKKGLLQAVKGSLKGEMPIFLRMAGIFLHNDLLHPLSERNRHSSISGCDPSGPFLPGSTGDHNPVDGICGQSQGGHVSAGPHDPERQPFRGESPHRPDAGQHVHASLHCHKVAGTHLFLCVRDAHGCFTGGDLDHHQHHGEADCIVRADDDDLSSTVLIS